MTDQLSIIADIQGAYQELHAAIDGLPPERMSEPFHDAWSAKDIVAHTSSWDEFTANDLRRIARGHLPCIAAFKESEVDEWNAFFMRPRRLFSLEQVLFESRHWHDTLIETLNGLPDSAFAAGMVVNLCALIAGHLRDHAGNIRDWREREGI